MKRSRSGWLCFALAAAATVAAFECGAADLSSWSYSGPAGPPKWGKLGKEYALCGTGTMQSPVDIVDADVRKGDLPALLFNYKPSPLRVLDNGHTIVVPYAPDSWVTVNGKRYQLVSIEFHKPSEGKINGKGHEMAAYLVHKADDNRVAVVSVFLDPGAENPMIKTLWSNLPATKGREQTAEAATINALSLLPRDKGYYAYTGSLTAPPCTEKVAWYVLKTPIEVSAEQIARFGRLYPMNARPSQPRNERDIVGTP